MTGRRLCCILARLSSSAVEQQFEKSSDLMVLVLTNYGMNLLGAIVTLIVGFGLADLWSRLADRAMRRADFQDWRCRQVWQRCACD